MTSADTAISRAELTDLSSVEMIARTTWSIAYAGIIPDEIQRRFLDRSYSAESLRGALVAPGSTFLVAKRSGSIVGFAQYVRRSAESVELMRIYVLPEKQRGDIGARLLDAALSEFAQENLRRLTVLVEHDNVSADASTRRWASRSREN